MKGHFSVTVIIFSCFANLVNAHCNGYNEVRARTHSGWVCGTVRSAGDNITYASFRGIPYAEQPLGQYRFAELRPKIPWDGYFNATNEGPVCPQYDDLYGNLVNTNRLMSEDCIRANVHVPYVTKNTSGYNEIDITAKLPILVFIHGGGCQVGSGDSDLHGPEYLVRKGVIVITFNYRLNAFGFMSLGSPEIPGNNGLRDMLTLLRWVKTNAKAFNGDPDNVTVAGQSAGSMCAHLLSLSLQSKDLFKRVMLFSGIGSHSFFSASPIYAKYVSNLFLTYLGINSTDPAYIHEQLINTSLTDIMEANKVVQSECGLVSFVPVVESPHDGTIIIDADPRTLVEMKRGKEYPMLVGFTSSEAAFFINKLNTLEILDRIDTNPALMLAPKYAFELPSNVSSSLAKKVVDRYFNGTPNLEAYMQSCSDTYFKYPGFLLSRMREAIGAPIYMYLYSYDADYNAVKLGLNLDYTGAAHVEDLTFIFRANAMLGNTSFAPESKDYYMMDWMTSTLVNFMTCSKPICTDDNLWLPSVNMTYQLISGPTMNITATSPTYEEYQMIEFLDAIEQESRDATLVE